MAVGKAKTVAYSNITIAIVPILNGDIKKMGTPLNVWRQGTIL
jgi:hypothetical protein